MKSLYSLNSKAQRKHRKFLRWLFRNDAGWERTSRFITGEASFRMVERLHRAGLVTAAMSRMRMFGPGTRPFRELEVFSTEQEARRQRADTVLVRR